LARRLSSYRLTMNWQDFGWRRTGRVLRAKPFAVRNLA